MLGYSSGMTNECLEEGAAVKAVDYKVLVELKNGESRQGSYPRILEALGLRDHYFLFENTLEQARWVALLLKEKYLEIERITILDEEGKEV